MSVVQWPAIRPCDPYPHTWDHLYVTNAPALSQFLGPHTKLYVELGTWCGASALVAAALAPHARIVCVDTWDGRGGWRNEYDELAPQCLDFCMGTLWSVRDRVTLLQMPTLDGVRHLVHEGWADSVDVAYVDADHSYESAYADIASCIASFPNAIVCGDDYAMPVGQAVRDILGAAFRVRNNTFWWSTRNVSTTTSHIRRASVGADPTADCGHESVAHDAGR